MVRKFLAEASGHWEVGWVKGRESMRIQLDEAGHELLILNLPAELVPDTDGFEALWALHPEEYHEITIHGRLVKTPRWQQAYGADYHYTGNTNVALPVPPILEPLRQWARRTVEARLNGLLLNWYDAALGHYLGPHHDSAKAMVKGAPIVTISLGDERVFRLSHPKQKINLDLPALAGTVYVLPYDTNLVWKHGVPRLKQDLGRRISVTLRAFTQT